MNYGVRLKEIRKNMNLTLDEVSKRTGFTKSFISQIENGKNSPSISSLQKICSSLNITISELFHNETPNVYILQKDDYHTYNFPQSTFSYMAKKYSGRKLEPLLISIDSKGEMLSKNCKITSEKFAYVVKGRVKLSIGNEEHNIEEGSLMYFSQNLPYKILNETDEEVTIFCVGINSLY